MSFLSSLRGAKPQHWVYLTDAGIGMTGMVTPKNAMPSVVDFDWLAEKDTLNSPSTLADWVAERARGTVNMLLGEGYYQLLLVDVPDVPAGEIESALRLKAAELINYDLEEATIEVILLPADAYRGRLRMAFIIAAQKPPLRAWGLELARRGLKLNCIDIDQLQLRNLAIRAQQRHQTGILHLDQEQCRLELLYENELVLTRQFDIGYQKLGYDPDGEPGLTLEDQTDIQIDSLVLELRRSFDYYESQLGLGTVNDVQLLGWPGNADLTTSLGSKLGLRFNLLMLEDYLMLPPSDNGVPEQLLPLMGTAFREGAP